MSLSFSATADARAPWTTGVLFVVFAWIPLLAWAAPLGFSPLVTIAGWMTLFAWKEVRRVVPIPALAAMLIFWASASAVWSPAFAEVSIGDYGDLEEQTWLKLILQFAFYTPVALAAWAMTPVAARRPSLMLAAVVLASAVVTLAEALTGAALYSAAKAAFDDPIRPDLARKNAAQAVYVLALLLWPTALVLMNEGRVRLALLLGLAVASAAVLFGASAPVLALAVSLVAFLIARAAPERGPKALAFAAWSFVLLFPAVVRTLDLGGVLDAVKPHLGASWAARLDIWSFAAERIFERPFTGWGLDASRTFGEAIPLHPHDFALQIWLELGLVGALIAATLWWAVFRLTRKGGAGDGASVGALAGAASAYFVISALSFGVWQEWWLALGVLTAACGFVAVRAREQALMETRDLFDQRRAPEPDGAVLSR